MLMNPAAMLAVEASGSGLLESEVSLIVLLAVAALVAVAARAARFPYTVALVVVGLLLAFLPEGFIEVEVSAELILAVLVPPLLFEGTLHISWRRFRADLPAVTLLAVGGTLVGSFAVGGMVHYLIDIPWAPAIAFGALISATDPVAVIAFFRSIGVSKRLTILVEGESLLNDGVSFVIFTLALGAAVPGTSFSVADAFGDFIVIAFGGIAVGVIMGYVVSVLILRNLDDHMVETAVTVALAFGSYLLAEEFGVLVGFPDTHLSGILAVVAAGLMVGNVGLQNTSPTTRLTLQNFWEFLSFVVNSMVFLLLGLEISITKLPTEALAVVVAVLAILLSRLLVVYGLGFLHGRIQPERLIPGRFKHVMYWGGLRGAISVGLALSLIAHADVLGDALVSQLQLMTFGVVLFTLVVQGLTIERLIRHLGLAERSDAAIDQQRTQARLYASRAARRELERLHREGILFSDLWNAMDKHYATEIDVTRETLRTHLQQHPELETDMYLTARIDALRAERQALQDAARRGLISEHVLEELTLEVNNHLAALDFMESDAEQGEAVATEATESALDEPGTAP
ncbi:MAG: Na+/H+ antiporter [bacterium]|nr:Na+/H+ antiporter [bacterium]